MRKKNNIEAVEHPATEILESHCDYMTDDKWDGMKQELEEMAKTTLS